MNTKALHLLRACLLLLTATPMVAEAEGPFSSLRPPESTSLEGLRPGAVEAEAAPTMAAAAAPFGWWRQLSQAQVLFLWMLLPDAATDESGWMPLIVRG